ncbi:hypothetical protein D9757_007531 [Collybiopsis confluens]|uniref:Spherulin 4-like cell surface protein n=1 Tax=Collybiopsis confluens TaxID=2823264 RepID=A0A8H5HJS4_9AGAR|nr:hypothetical protein D9757_007531 [Collybiopsis confluens]
MFSLKKLISAACLAQSFLRGVKATGAIFPLYIYPNDDCSAWSEVFSSITANPTLPITLIINPNSGPTTDPNYPYTCFQQAKTLSSNLRTVGYVPTGYGTGRTSSAVLADVSTYLNWPTAYRPSGIFFDETNATSDFFNLYSTYASSVRQSIPSGSIVSVEDLTFELTFDVTDFVYVHRSSLTRARTWPIPGSSPSPMPLSPRNSFYDDFSFPSSLIINSTEPASKQIVILHDGPSTLPTSLIQQLSAGGIASTFITNEPQADAYNNVPSYWEQFVDELANLQ